MLAIKCRRDTSSG